MAVPGIIPANQEQAMTYSQILSLIKNSTRKPAKGSKFYSI